MSTKLNFQQTMPKSRDIGGFSGITLLVIGVGVCLIWALLVHAIQ